MGAKKRRGTRTATTMHGDWENAIPTVVGQGLVLAWGMYMIPCVGALESDPAFSSVAQLGGVLNDGTDRRLLVTCLEINEQLS
jgi:hypothetical protein